MSPWRFNSVSVYAVFEWELLSHDYLSITCVIKKKTQQEWSGILGFKSRTLFLCVIKH